MTTFEIRDQAITVLFISAPIALLALGIELNKLANKWLDRKYPKPMISIQVGSGRYSAETVEDLKLIMSTTADMKKDPNLWGV
jgi:hypothetical protein